MIAIAHIRYSLVLLGLFLYSGQLMAATECTAQQILQKGLDCTGDGMEAEETKLYQLLNEYRAQNNLPPIPLSKSLTLVANRHVQDLAKNVKTLTHGWSNCAYNSGNSSTYPCMWEQPQRLGTDYPSEGYENAYFSSNNATASGALTGWKNSSAHNDVILNKSIWRSFTWQAIGIGIYENYAVLWFGADKDPAGEPRSTTTTTPVVTPVVTNPTTCPVPTQAPYNTYCTAQGCTYKVNITRAGFYVANVRLPAACQEGYWGLSVITSSTGRFNGFSVGAILPNNANTPAFATFNIRNTSKVDLSPLLFRGEAQNLNSQLKRIETAGTRTTQLNRTTKASGEAISASNLSAGQYLIEVYNEAQRARGYFGISLTGDFNGGVDFGGFIDANTSGSAEVGGFSQFVLANPQTVTLQLFMRDFYANNIGAAFLDIDIFEINASTGARTLYWTSTKP